MQATSRLAVWWAQAKWLVPLFLAGLYVALVPSFKLIPFSPYDSKRLLQLGVLLAGAGWTVYVPSVRAEWLRVWGCFPRSARWGLAGVVALGVASSLLATEPRLALLDVFHYVLLFNFALTTAVACCTVRHLFERGVLVMLGACVLLYAITFAVGYGMHLVNPEIALWPEGHTGFGNKRFFNQLQSWSLPLLVLPALWTTSQWLRGLSVAATATWWMLLFASGARGTTLSMVVAAVGIVIIFRRRAWMWLRWQGIAALVGGLLYGLLFQLISRSGVSIAERADLQSGGRLEDWRNALASIPNHPLLGIGPMHTAYDGNALWPTIHNAFLQIGVEWGLPALLIVVGLAGWGFWAWCQSASQQNESSRAHTEVVLTASLLAAGFHAMVSGVIVMPVSQVMMTVVMGWVVGLYFLQGEESPSVQPSVRSWVLPVFLLVAAGIVIWASYPEAFSANERILRFVVEKGTFRFAPRYWSQGVFGY